jgi:hypothetical protein
MLNELLDVRAQVFEDWVNRGLIGGLIRVLNKYSNKKLPSIPDTLNVVRGSDAGRSADCHQWFMPIRPVDRWLLWRGLRSGADLGGLL